MYASNPLALTARYKWGHFLFYTWFSYSDPNHTPHPKNTHNSPHPFTLLFFFDLFTLRSELSPGGSQIFCYTNLLPQIYRNVISPLSTIWTPVVGRAGDLPEPQKKIRHLPGTLRIFGFVTETLYATRCDLCEGKLADCIGWVVEPVRFSVVRSGTYPSSEFEAKWLVWTDGIGVREFNGYVENEATYNNFVGIQIVSF